MREEKSINFAYKEHTIQGVISCGLFFISVLILILTIRLSWEQAGESGILVGITGILSFLLCVIGSYMGYRALKIQERVEKWTAWFGMIANTILAFALLALYIWGYMSLLS